jgi:hypothetical protein
VDVVNQADQIHSLNIIVVIRALNACFMLTVAYGSADDAGKPAFLDELQTLKPHNQTPWIVVGDFNLIYQASDKNNLHLNRRLMGTFRQSLNTCELFEFGLQNRKFVWRNEREDPTLIRLDIMFCNKEWELLLPDYMLIALSSSLSDHYPILLCQQTRPRFKDNFCFENFWPKVLDFTEVVKEAWDHDVQGASPLNTLFFQLLNTSVALKGWSKKLFANTWVELHIANDIIGRLDIAQESR